MAYTNAIFFLDYVNGNDAARTTLSSVVFSNPSSTTVLGTKVGHGLVTGAVITVSGCTQAYANSTWKITRVDADTFTLDTALWASFNGADVTGDVVPFGGQSWADAWKTITGGPTSSRVYPGDIVKIAKSPAPSILAGATGHATWTDLSKTVTLADAQTANITLCEADWTAVNATSAAKLAVATDAKEGSYCVKVIEDATPAANEVQAYFATGDLTLSGYQKISFWIKNEVAILADQLELNLCSNADGTGDIDVIPIPAIPSTGNWIPLTIARNGGGNLGSSTIKSINISNGSAATPYTASKYVYLDNIIACTTSGLNLQSLISKNALETGGTEDWYPIQSINGTAVLLDNNSINEKSTGGRGYSTLGTTPETVDTYFRETIKTAMVSSGSSGVQSCVGNDGSIAGGNVQLLGGYNITDATGATRDGETFFDGLCGTRYGLSLGRQWYTISHLGFFRYRFGIYMASARYNLINNCFIGGLEQGIYIDSSPAIKNIFTDCHIYNCAGPCVYITTEDNANEFWGCYFLNTNTGVQNGANNNQFHACTFMNNLTGYNNGNYVNYLYDCVLSKNTTGSDIDSSSCVAMYLYNCALNSTNPVKTSSLKTQRDWRIYSTKHGQAADTHVIYTDYGAITSDNGANRHTASGICWKLSPTNQARNYSYPLELPIAKIACAASAAVTVTAYVKKTHATDIGARLLCKRGQIAGLTVDYEDVKANDTDYENLSITFTPSEAGVVEIVLQAYWQANTADESVYVDDVTISQA